MCGKNRSTTFLSQLYQFPTQGSTSHRAARNFGGLLSGNPQSVASAALVCAREAERVARDLREELGL